MLNELLEVACVRPTSRARTPSRVDLAELVAQPTRFGLAEERRPAPCARGYRASLRLRRRPGSHASPGQPDRQRHQVQRTRRDRGIASLAGKGFRATRAARPGTRNWGALSALRLRLVPSRAPIAARCARRSRDWPRDGPPSRAASWRCHAGSRRPGTGLDVYRNASALLRPGENPCPAHQRSGLLKGDPNDRDSAVSAHVPTMEMPSVVQQLSPDLTIVGASDPVHA